ncbi:MAG: hypothetical protein K2O45_12945 [Oscillospiraceae bacterium]|nr:hypothetical protein [Oscillospiraceae bacterium]
MLSSDVDRHNINLLSIFAALRAAWQIILYDSAGLSRPDGDFLLARAKRKQKRA